jgi:integrase
MRDEQDAAGQLEDLELLRKCAALTRYLVRFVTFSSQVPLRCSTSRWQSRRRPYVNFPIKTKTDRYPRQSRRQSAHVPAFFATDLLTRGVPIEEVAMLLGHSSRAITQKYYSHFVKARRDSPGRTGANAVGVLIIFIDLPINSA